MPRLVRQLLTCFVIALAPTLLNFAYSGRAVTPSRLWYVFVSSFVFASCIAIPLEHMLTRLMPRMARVALWIKLPLYVLLIAGYAMGGTLFGSVILCALGFVPWKHIGDLYRGAIQVSLVLTALFGAGGMTMGAMQHRLQEANTKLREKEAAEREARLLSLESRVHPHFLFNAINSILALIREDPRRAEDLLERMAALLRFSLDQTQGLTVPLEHELRVVRDYLEIEKARFGDRLRFTVEADPGSALDVPPLSIQTLVENAVKFAVSPRREGGLVNVSVADREITVSDDGPGFDESMITKGHGLDLLRQRLEGTGTLSIERTSPGARVKMVLHA